MEASNTKAIIGVLPKPKLVYLLESLVTTKLIEQEDALKQATEENEKLKALLKISVPSETTYFSK